MSPLPIPWNILSSTVGVGILTDGWNLAELGTEGETSRSFEVEITFAAPFTFPPVVQLALTGFDFDQRDSSRVTLKATSITPHGFTASISTWAATRVYAVEFNWLAIGA
jgi:hypothetical protein